MSTTKVIKSCIAFFLFGLLVFFSFSSSSAPVKKINGKYQVKNDVPKELIKLNQQKSKGFLWQTNNYVSIAQLNDNYFVIANYVNLLLLNNKTNKLCVLTPLGLANYKDVSSLSYLSKVLKSKVYIPTGVFIDQRGSLFVANYKANNILEGTVNVQKCEVHFNREFSSENTKGPENVSVDNNKSILVSANYDAGTVTAFNLKSGKELWSTPIGQAHGVTISDDKVFATGLTERKIYELNLNNGSIINSIGSAGWDPMKSQFLWPTSIYPYDKDKLIISDAQTGYISFLDKKSLQTIKYTGGNGPSYSWFNYPYAAYPTDKNIIILSSMRGNILFLDFVGNQVLKNLIFVKDTWPKVNYSKSTFGLGWDAYININGPLLTLRGQQYRLGFGHLHPVDSGPTLRVPNISTLYNLGPYMYFLQGYYTQKVNFIFSSSSTTLLTIENEMKKPDILLSNKVRLDSWLYNQDIISVDGNTYTESKLITDNSLQAKKIYSQLDKNGWLNTKEIYELNDFSVQTRRLGYKEFLKYLDDVFQSPIGREFKFSYDQCSEAHCNIKNLRKAAKNYYFEASGYSYLNLDEYILVGMLSGTPVEKNASTVKVDYDNCNQGHYYEGYGIESIKHPTKSSYLSAIDLANSFLCLSTKVPRKLESLKFEWLSQDDVPHKLALYGIKHDGEQKHKDLIGEFKPDTVTTNDGYVFTTLHFSNLPKYQRVEIKLLEGGKQNRLLLRTLEPSFVKDESANSIHFDDCGVGQYYPGYGINALKTKTLDSYLSAENLQTSAVCFSNKKAPKSLNSIRFFWYTESEIPKKIALYAVTYKDGHEVKIDLGSHQIDSYQEINGHIYSDLAINEKRGFSKYMIRLLEGGAQNRLLVRSIQPIFENNSISSNSYIMNLADSISKKLHYGAGISSIESNKINCTQKGIVRSILSSKTAHCGNYAYLFVSSISPIYSWIVYDLKTSDGRIHSVVEIIKNKQTQTVDPTLGVLYPCSVNQLINGSCSYLSAEYLTLPNQALNNYFGVGFFYGAKILRTYADVNELSHLYC